MATINLSVVVDAALPAPAGTLARRPVRWWPHRRPAWVATLGRARLASACASRECHHPALGRVERARSHRSIDPPGADASAPPLGRLLHHAGADHRPAERRRHDQLGAALRRGAIRAGAGRVEVLVDGTPIAARRKFFYGPLGLVGFAKARTSSAPG
jgi:hypothetical protein